MKSTLFHNFCYLDQSGPIWDEPSGTPPKGSWSSRDHFWSKWPLAETRKQPFLRQLQNGENELPERDPPRGGPKDLKIVAFKLKTRLKQLK